MKTNYLSLFFFSFFFLIFLIFLPSKYSYSSVLDFFVEDELLISFKQKAKLQLDERSILRVDDMQLKVMDYYPKNNVFLVKRPADISVRDVVNRVSSLEYVEFAEPNYYRQALFVTPNDPLFGQQWALTNIQADRAWEQTKGNSNVVVAIADSGIDYIHEDLLVNRWRNPGEICGNGIDDNGDGYIDNCYGINAIDNSGDPMDDEGHGTHVSGIIGAVGNNSKGISGVNWNVSLMALKFIDANGSGKVSDLIKTIEFAMDKKVKIFNMSFGSYNFSQFEKDAMKNASDILFIAAAGNEFRNNNVSPLYPASYDLPNIISVGASNQSNNLATFSNYGSQTVSLVAPGTNILSTLPNDNYAAYSGSSMSTAYVSGVAGLVSARHPSLNAEQIKDRILRTVDVIPELKDKIITGGRLNADRALRESVSGPYIYNLYPTKGWPGSEVSIQGSGFQSEHGRVVFTDIEAQIRSWSSHKIVCQVPEGAETGDVQVVTRSNLSSNKVPFEVSNKPEARRISFAYASTKEDENYFLILLNMFEHPVKIYARAVSDSGEKIYKIYDMKPYERKIINISEFLIYNDDLYINLESDEFFGAAMLKFSRDLKKFHPIYSNPWGPSISEEFGDVRK